MSTVHEVARTPRTPRTPRVCTSRRRERRRRRGFANAAEAAEAADAVGRPDAAEAAEPVEVAVGWKARSPSLFLFFQVLRSMDMFSPFSSVRHEMRTVAQRKVGMGDRYGEV